VPIADDGSVSIATRHLVGREIEFDRIIELLDVPAQLPRTLVLQGEAGIGKTTLWLASVDAAAARGYRVLSSRSSDVETRFSFSGLTDILGDAAGDVLPGLPPVQQRALEAALLLGKSSVVADDRAVAAASLAALRAVARECPVCIAIDDVQWLDAASAAALGYALARLGHEPIMAVVAVRGATPSWLHRAIPHDQLRIIEVGGLSVGAIFDLIRSQLGTTLPRPTLIRIWETARGNPLFALEFARTLIRSGHALTPGDDLVIPPDLDELLRTRVDALGAAGLHVARVVESLADPTVSLVESAMGPEADAGLAETLAVRILELDGKRVRFTHPLLGSAIAAGQTPARRRSLHALLSDLVPSTEERARHLALATDEPDRDVAATLEAAGRTAHERGAMMAAADLAEQALRLTPPALGDDARRRLLDAADLHHRAGDTPRAVALLDQARARAETSTERARLVAALASVQATPRETVALYREALSDAADDDELQATIYLGLSDWMAWTDGNERGLEYAQLAVRAAARAGDIALQCRALALYGEKLFRAGRGIASAVMEEAIALERSLVEWPLKDGPTDRFGYQLCWAAEVVRARELYEEFWSLAKGRNDVRAEATALWSLGFLEWRAGNWAQAARYADDCVDLTSQVGPVMPPDEFPAAIIAAHQGRVDDARATSERALALAETEGLLIALSGHSWMLGFVELSLGDAEAALPLLRRAYELRNDFMNDPAQRVELGDLLAVLIAVGALDEAEGVIATWQERAAALDRAWSLAILARSSALLQAVRGDLAGAFASFERALAEHQRSADPFQHARTLLALGSTQRRAKRRAAARATLEQALAMFDRLGAQLWSDQTRGELTRIGGRTSAGDQLSEGERRIAELVALGRTNREVASALFLTEHSVETRLTGIYRKLGVRSRAELAHLTAPKT
jgi:DNA-binding CsgD family transcriptional regulator